MTQLCFMWSPEGTSKPFHDVCSKLVKQLSLRSQCRRASTFFWVELFTMFSQSATVSGCRSVKLWHPNLHIPSHTRSLQVIRAFPPPPHTHTHSSLVLPRHLKSVKSPSISPPLSLSIQLLLFLCGPTAVTAPSHVCQSQLARLLLAAHTHW